MTVEEFKKIIARAIAAEIEAYEFYAGVEQKIQDNNMKGIFGELAGEEKQHRIFLESVLSGARPMSIDESKDYSVSATFDKPALSLTMKPVDAIALAVKNEEEAMTMYAALAGIAADPEQKTLFESLARMEKGHKFRLEEMYTNMAFPEVW
jgi:rubrerythrin